MTSRQKLIAQGLFVLTMGATALVLPPRAEAMGDGLCGDPLCWHDCNMNAGQWCESQGGGGCIPDYCASLGACQPYGLYTLYCYKQ